MQHEVTQKGDATIVALVGDVDLASSPIAREVLLKCVASRRSVVVDLSRVTYIDSSGVASLVESFQRARKAGSRFALAAASEATLRVLKLARLDKVFQLYATVDDGLAQGL